MRIATSRYSRDDAFRVLRLNLRFVTVMAAGSVVGAVAGGALVQYVAGPALVGILAVILLVSAWKVWRHDAVSAPPSSPAR